MSDQPQINFRLPEPPSGKELYVSYADDETEEGRAIVEVYWENDNGTRHVVLTMPTSVYWQFVNADWKATSLGRPIL